MLSVQKYEKAHISSLISFEFYLTTGIINFGK